MEVSKKYFVSNAQIMPIDIFVNLSVDVSKGKSGSYQQTPLHVSHYSPWFPCNTELDAVWFCHQQQNCQKMFKSCGTTIFFNQQSRLWNTWKDGTQDINQSRIKKRLQAGREASPIRKPEPPLLLLVLPVKPACQPNVKPRKVNTHLPIPFVHLWW